MPLGGLTCRQVDLLPDGTSPQAVAILCHGFGAPGTDLVPLAAETFALDRELAGRVRFLFPEAPLSLDDQGLAGGRAWWPLNVAALMAAIDSGDFRDLRRERPPGLDAARERLTALITEVREQTGLPLSRIVLGGFSQGAMLATDAALRLPEPPGALVIFSGTLLDETVWRGLASRRGAMRILQSHGTQDPILPYAAAEWLRDLWTESGQQVEFLPFVGPHTIPLDALQRLSVLLRQVSEQKD